MIITKYSVDMLYYSPCPWVAHEYLQDKIAKGGFWKNWGGTLCETQIVSAGSMSLEEYKVAWLRLTGDCYKMEDRYNAMTTCSLLVNLYSVCEIAQ